MLQAPGRATWFLAFTSPALAAFAMLTVLALPTLQGLCSSWQHCPDYTHCWLLVPALACLCYRSNCWQQTGEPQRLLGAVTMLAGGVVHLLAMVIPWPLIDYVGWVLLIRGLLLIYSGREAAGRLMPVLAFAVLLFPLPQHWLNQVAMQLQDVIARVADGCLSVVWVCHRRGQLLYLAGMDEPLSVAVECSGVRQILAFLALAWFLAFYLKGSIARRLLLVLAAIPLAILANVVRVLALAIVAKLAGPQAMAGVLHDAPLAITLPLGALLLWLLFQRLQRPAMQQAVAAPAMPVSTRLHTTWLPTILAGALLGLQLLLQIHLSASCQSQPEQSLALEALPMQLGAWKGSPHPEEERIIQQAEFADATLLRTYSNSQGQAAAVYLVYSKTGRDRLHHPEICLRDAAGAVPIRNADRSILLQPGDQRVAQRFCFQRHQQQKVTVYYWHYTLLPASSPEQSVLQRIHTIQHEHWPSYTVQVQCNRADAATWQALEKTLLPELDRWFQQQLPTTARTGNERLPTRMTWER